MLQTVLTEPCNVIPKLWVKNLVRIVSMRMLRWPSPLRSIPTIGEFEYGK